MCGGFSAGCRPEQGKAGSLRAGGDCVGWACKCTPGVNNFGGEGHVRDEALG